MSKNAHPPYNFSSIEFWVKVPAANMYVVVSSVEKPFKLSGQVDHILVELDQHTRHYVPHSLLTKSVWIL